MKQLKYADGMNTLYPLTQKHLKTWENTCNAILRGKRQLKIVYKV